ncbi:hypothetical protein BD408DRAFT_351345, partial [Parasitella parasitica]
PSDFINDIQLGCQIFAIDPGIRDITTAVDQLGRERTTSLKEYYHLCGFNVASTQREQHKKQYMNEYQKISTLSSFKTTNLEDFVKACKERFDLYDDIKKYYDSDDRSSKLKFKCYIKKQKCIEEICRRLTYGSAKYGEKSRMIEKKQTTSYIPPTPIDHDIKPRKTILALGNAMFNGSLRGNKSAPVRRIRESLRKRRGETLDICFIDEYLTSQVCNICKERNLENVTTAKSVRRVHTVLQCQQNTCNTVWNRDIMAANNILDIFLFAVFNNNERPDIFKRHTSPV